MGTNIQIDFSDVSAFAKEIESFNRTVDKLETNMQGISRAINAFGGEFKELTTIFDALQKATQGVDVVFLDLSQAMTSVAKIPSIGKNINGVSKFVKEIGELFRVLSSADSLGSFNINAFFKTIRDLFTQLNSLNTINIKGGGQGLISPKDLEVKIKLFKQFGKAFKQIFSAIKDVPAIPQDVSSSFSSIIKSISVVFKLFGNIPETLGDSVNGFLGAIPILNKIFGGNTRLTKTLKGIRPFTKILAEAVKNLNDIGSPNTVRAAGNAIRAMKDIFARFSEIDDTKVNFSKFEGVLSKLGKSTRLTSALKGIRPFTKLLADALRAFNEIPPVENLRSVATTFQGLSEIVKVFGALNDDDINFSKFEKILSLFGKSTRLTSILKGIKPLAKLLAEAINEFKKVKVSPNLLTPIASFVIGLAKVIDVLIKENVDDERAQKAADAVKTIVKSLVEAINESSLLQSNGSAFNSIENAGERTVNAYYQGVQNAAKGGKSKALGGFVIQQFADGLTGSIADQAGIFGKVGKAAFNALSTGFRFLKQNVADKLGFTSFTKSLLGLFSNTIKEIRNFGNTIDNQFNNIAQNVRNTARGLVQGGFGAIATGGFAGFLNSSAVQLTRTFDAVIKQVGVFGDLTVEELGKAQDAILEFSAVTKFGPAESAQAFLDLQKAGLSAATALKTLPSVGAFAVASNLDIASSTQLALQSLNGFGLGIEDVTRVIDAFVGGADISTAGVSELAQALGFVAPSANALSISIEDTTTALALLNDQAISGERAGTGLRAVLDALAAPTDEAKKTFEELDIKLTDSNGNFIGLSETIFQFQDAITGLREAGAGDVEILERLSSIGDRNAVATLLALIKEGSGTMDEFADGSIRASTAFDDYRKNLEGANKATDIAAELSDTIDAAITSLTGSIQALIITGFQPLLNDNIKPIVEALTAFVNKLAKLPKPVLKFAAGLSVASAALVTLGGIISVFVGILLFSLIPALQAASILFSVLFNPAAILATGAALTTTFAIAIPVLLAFGAGVTLVGGMLFKLYTDVKNNVGGAKDRFNELLVSINNVKTTISELFSSAIEFFSTFIKGAQDANKEVANLDKDHAVANFLATLKSGVDKLVSALNELKLFFDFFSAIAGGGLTSATPISETDALLQRRLEIQKQLNEAGIDGFQTQVGLKEQERDLLLLKQRQLETAEAIREQAKGLSGEEKKAAEERAKGFDERAKAIDEEIAKLDTQFTALADRTSAKYLIKSGDTLSQISQSFGVSIAEILKANPEITDPNLIFAGRELVIPGLDTTAVTDDISAVEKELALIDAQIAARQDEIGRGAIQENVVIPLTKAQSIIKEFSQTNIFKRLFGEDDLAVTKAIAFVGELEEKFQAVYESVQLIGKGLSNLFNKGKFKSGIKQIVSGLSTIALKGTELFETLTGVDISDKLQENLRVGNIKQIFADAANFLGNQLETLFITLQPYIIDGIGLLAKFLLRNLLGGVVRLALNIFGIKTFDPIFDQIDNVINVVVDKLKATIKDALALARGDLDIAGFFLRLFEVEGIVDQADLVFALGDIGRAIDELKLSFIEFGRESGIDKLLGGVKKLDDGIKPLDVATGIIRGFAKAITLLAIAIAFIGPAVAPILEDISLALIELQTSINELDDEQLKDIAIGLALLGGVLAGFAIIAVGPTLLTIAAGFLALYIVFKILGNVIDPVLAFLQDLGDFVQELSKGDFKGAFAELRELFTDLQGVGDAITEGTFDGLIDVLEVIERLTGANTTPIINLLDKLKALATGDTSPLLGELRRFFGVEFAQKVVFLSNLFEQLVATIQFALLGVIYSIGGSLESLINGIILKIPGAKDFFGTDNVDLTLDIDKAYEDLKTKIADLNNENVVIKATIELAQGKGINDEITGAIKTGDSSLFSEFISNALANDFSTTDLSSAFKDAIAGKEINAQDLFKTLIGGVSAGTISPEDATKLVPTNLLPAFNQAVSDAFNAGLASSEGQASDPLLSALLTSINNEENSTAITNAGKQAGTNLIAGLAQGLEEGRIQAETATNNAMTGVTDAVSTTLETNSPSRFTARQGLYLMQGLQQGIMQNLFLATDAIRSVTSTLDILSLGVKTVQLTIEESFALAALAMQNNVLIMQASIDALIGSLQYLAAIAGAALQSVNLVNNASVATPTAPNVPQFADGGYTGKGRSPFLAMLHPEEVVVNQKGQLAVRETPAFADLLNSLSRALGTRQLGMGFAGAGDTITNVTYTWGDIHIQNANPNHKMTPAEIAHGIKLYTEQNPPSRKLRNKL